MICERPREPLAPSRDPGAAEHDERRSIEPLRQRASVWWVVRKP